MPQPSRYSRRYSRSRPGSDPTSYRNRIEGISPGGVFDYRVDAVDAIEVTCSFHSWMGAWIVVRDNPYWAVTDSEGHYAIDDVPDGSHRVVAWHEAIGRFSPRGRAVDMGGVDVEMDWE